LAAFEEKLTKEIEDWVSKNDDVKQMIQAKRDILAVDPNISENEMKTRSNYSKIRMVNFTFRNASVIGLLYKRAGALMTANFDGARKVEKSIEDFIAKNYENVVTPTRAHAIFEFD